MKFYEVTIILDNKQQERLESLVKGFERINGWKEKDIIQFAVNSLIGYMETMLTFMEAKAEQLKDI